MAAEHRQGIARTVRGSVRVRITSAAVGVVGLTLLVGAIGLVWTLHAVLAQQVRGSATVRAAELARVVESGGDAGNAVPTDDVVFQVFDPAGRVLAGSANATGAAVLPVLMPGESRVIRVPFDDGAFLAVAAPAGAGRTVVLAQGMDPVEESTQALAALLAIGLPVLLVVVGMTAWRMVGRALAPVDAIRTEVEVISATQLHRRVPGPAAQDEIGRLADTMNAMLDRLERSRTRERRFVADASHELRSPIAAIRQHAEVALAHPEHGAELARVAHDESVRMQALVDDLLLLAQADARTLPARRVPVDLDDLVLDEAKRLRELRQSTVDTRGVGAARVAGDPAALRRVVQNLGDNAVGHARGQVALGVSEQDGWAVLHIDDDGPGIPEEQRHQVFERFVRLDGARARAEGGAGLGLAIVAEIVAAHGGIIGVGDSPLGGVRATVRLPLSRA